MIKDICQCGSTMCVPCLASAALDDWFVVPNHWNNGCFHLMDRNHRTMPGSKSSYRTVGQALKDAARLAPAADAKIARDDAARRQMSFQPVAPIAVAQPVAPAELPPFTLDGGVMVDKPLRQSKLF